MAKSKRQAPKHILDKVKKVWDMIDPMNSNWVQRWTEEVGGAKYLIDIDYEEFTPSFDLNIDSLKQYEASLKNLVTTLTVLFKENGLKVDIKYTHSPFKKGSYTDVQFEIHLTDTEEENKIKRIGKFQDFLEV